MTIAARLTGLSSNGATRAARPEPADRPSLPWLVRVQRWYRFGPRSGALLARMILPRLRPRPVLLSLLALAAPVIACFQLHPIAGWFALAPAALLAEVRLADDLAPLVALVASRRARRGVAAE